MLGATYRVQALNSTGVSVTVQVRVKRRKFDTDGSLLLESADESLISTAASAAGTANSSAVDNTTNKYLFAEFTVVLTPSASATGLVSVALQRSTDGVTWPDNGRGEILVAHQFAASSSVVTYVANIE